MDVSVSDINVMGSNKCVLNQLFVLTFNYVVTSSPNSSISIIENDAEQCQNVPEQGVLATANDMICN